MRKLAIIGTGLAGLRAGLALAQVPNVALSYFEKSPSVGGRVATRRFAGSFVNHGAPVFEDLAKVLELDPEAKKFQPELEFSREATALPKAMREHLVKQFGERVSFHFNTRVRTVTSLGVVTLEDGGQQQFDHVIITAPLPQIREMLGTAVLPQITYDKRVLFIGVNPQGPVRLELSRVWSEAHFELPDSDLRTEAQQFLEQDLSGLDLKKWRYAEVRQGLAQSHYRFAPTITLAGDAFDPTLQHRASAAWLSGLAAAQALQETL